MIIALFFFFVIQSQMTMFPQIYSLFGQTFGTQITWYCIFFGILMGSALQLGYKFAVQPAEFWNPDLNPDMENQVDDDFGKISGDGIDKDLAH